MEIAERHIASNDGLTLLFVAVILLFGILNKRYRQDFALFLKMPQSNAYFRVQQKSKTLFNNFNILLSVTSGLVISLCLYTFLKSVGRIEANTFEWTLFVQIFIAYLAFLTIKYLAEKIIGEVFEMQKFMNKYLSFKLGIRNFSSLVTLPFIAIAVYFTDFNFSFTSVIIYTFLFFQVALLTNFYLVKRRLLTPHWFYFILYLCSFEITPYFILYKMLA